jgi:hypothetical protein
MSTGHSLILAFTDKYNYNSTGFDPISDIFDVPGITQILDNYFKTNKLEDTAMNNDLQILLTNKYISMQLFYRLWYNSCNVLQPDNKTLLWKGLSRNVGNLV